MFTGIIEAVGEIVACEPRGGDLRLRVKTFGLDLAGISLGDSIATNGVCLTVIELPGDGYVADRRPDPLARPHQAGAGGGREGWDVGRC